MIPIKEHNDIVQKLMKELTTKESDLKMALKEKSKVPSQAPQLQPSSNEKLLTSKINQLNKEYKDKITNLTQKLRSKSIENKELKERLTTKSNMQAKQKDHISEILKKGYDRKPSSAADYKISALITHYEAEITKKSKFIENLQKQIRQYETQASSSKTQIEDNENYKQGIQNESKPKGVTLVEHQREIGRIKMEAIKFKKLYEQKQKEYKDISRRYTQLTNEYYKIINAYGLQESNKTQTTFTKIKSVENVSKSRTNLQSKLKANALQNLLQEMVVSDSDFQENSQIKTFPREIKVKPSCFRKDEECETEDVNQQAKDIFAISKLDEILSLLQLADPSELISKLSKMKTQIEQYELVDTVSRSLQVFFYNIGKGKISKKELVFALQDLEQSYNKNLQAVDLLDEICIEVGAKREKLSEKIEQLNKIKSEYFQQLKNLKYTQQLSKGNKVIEFIDFFQLDKEQLVLPQQLAQIQEQLKTINKYIKEVRAILEIDPEKSSQMVLQLALRYMQKSTSFMSQYEKKPKSKNLTN